MMTRKVDNEMECWCAASANRKQLDSNFPIEKGYYEVFDINVMSIGAETTVTHEGGLEVTSKSAENGYYTFTAKAPGK